MNIGILGGGQLGMMMATEALKLHHQVISLDPNPTCSISRYAKKHLPYDYNDQYGIDRLIKLSDVLTYEFENVNAKVLHEIEIKLPQKTTALLISQNRLLEKDLAKRLGIRTPKYKQYFNEKDLFAPAIIKTITGGYDGKGQINIDNYTDIEQINLVKDRKYIIEEKIAFDYEISVIATRDIYREVVFYPIPKNVHRQGILYTSTLDNTLPKNIQYIARKYTQMIIEELDYIGTLAVEYFVQGDKVIFNEFAPRPHNSGHYTIEGCDVSQFKNHILAITKEKIIQPKLINPTIMINVLGQDLEYLHIAKSLKNVSIHDYYKTEVRKNRKMGHITITCPTMEQCLKLKQIITKKNNGENE